MGPSAPTSPARSIAKRHRQALDRHVVHALVVGTLQERRIYRRERLVALAGEAGGKVTPCCSAIATSEAAFGEALGELVEAGPGRHRSRDRHDLRIDLGLGDQCLGEHRLVGRRIGDRLGLLAGHDVELHDAVVLVGAGLGGRIALALLGHDMDQDRLGETAVARVAQYRQEMVDVVPVDRPHIVEAHLVEQRATSHEAAREFLGAARRPSRAAWATARRRSGQSCAARPRDCPTAGATDDPTGRRPAVRSTCRCRSG